ncbi:hypothetical protein DMN91_007733 [Ooceraea biroi]|uniref:Uncharacterized protein n=1 Tax=Ooceraea biroi TaxID=2015173 RepID=A0A026WUA0_OOCBI|nr:SAC3 family protein A [Ooceraea biroi]XP_026827816.1 SAC3 family protein A [Ooceraea biroi]EZA59236.1 hypothetical protein X777_15879 [Ooceraea biroi]RLU19176.1 hypothetical protein DMN91_007733 [Ooceraea biroi]
MNFCTTLGILFGTLLITIVPDTAAYSKYGRTCKDIGCRSDETCVMAEDPCTGYTDKCGRYPTCKRTSDVSCVHIMCGQNEYCKMENGTPKCVSTTAQGYESAGVSYVNGERTSGNNANPYANANAPPAPANRAEGGFHQSSSSSGSNSAYPPYPSNTGSSNGYPPYPQSTNQASHTRDLGYPPYPTQNRMPMPGQSSYPGYPQSSGYPQNSGYPQQYPGHQGHNPYPNYPQQNYPGQNYPNQNQRGYTYSSNSLYRRNAASVGVIASMILVGFSELFVFMMTRL